MRKFRKKQYIPSRNHQDDLRHLDIESVVSSNDCTGLVPSSPTDQSQKEGYQDIIDAPISPE